MRHLAFPSQVAVATALDARATGRHWLTLRRGIVAALLLACACRPPGASPRPAVATLASRLGLPDSARILVLHADDMAMTPGVDRATLAALQAGDVRSASIIATTPYLDSLAAALKGSTFDLGAHLTLTSESDSMRWSPAAGAANAASLVDSTGRLLTRVQPTARGEDVERELDAQIARLRAAGITLTHLDSHQGALFFNGKEVFDAFRRVAKRACLPMLVSASAFGEFPYLEGAVADGHVPMNDVLSIAPTVSPADWARYYDDVVRSLRPGVSMLLVHVGEDTDAERVHFRAHTGWGADWRARDAQVLAAPAFRQLLRDQNIHLMTWREVAQAANLCPRAPA